MEMVQPHNYYNVQGWMVTELGLKGNELHAYAIIYGFSQDGVSEFVGSLQYLSDWLSIERRSTIRVLNSLTEKKLIIKRVVKNGVDPNGYKAIRPVYTGSDNLSPGVVTKVHEGGDNLSPEVVTKVHGGSDNLSPNNNNNIYKNNNNYIDTRESEKAPKKKYGEYQNVLLTDEELGKLQSKCPTDWQERIEKLSKEIDESGTKYKSHYAVLIKWVDKKEYGEFKNVLLTDEELDKLKASYPTDWQERIDRLSEYMDSSGANYKSHYATIKVWDRREKEKQKQSSAGRTGTAGRMVGPNGISIDPTKNDLDGYF